MTCVAGLVDDTGCVWMGGDSAVVSGLDLMIGRQQKVVRKGAFLFGVAGHPRFQQLLEHVLTLPEHPADMSLERYVVTRLTVAIRDIAKEAGYAKKDNEQEKLDSRVLIGYRGRLFALDTNYQMLEPSEGYFAIGSGDMLALGALYASESLLPPHERLSTALEAAAHFNTDVRPPFKICKLGMHPESDGE